MSFNLADLFESVVDVVPDREALVAGERRLRYAQLDERANRLAHRLAAARGRARRPRRPPAHQRQRVHRGDARCVQAARGADQRELPLRRRRAAPSLRRCRPGGAGAAPPLRARASPPWRPATAAPAFRRGRGRQRRSARAPRLPGLRGGARRRIARTATSERAVPTITTSCTPGGRPALPEGRGVATRGHLLRGDGRRRSAADGQADPRTRGAAGARAATADRGAAGGALHARCCAVAGVPPALRREHARAGAAGGAFDPAAIWTLGGTRARPPAGDRRRRDGDAARRRARGAARGAPARRRSSRSRPAARCSRRPRRQRLAALLPGQAGDRRSRRFRDRARSGARPTPAPHRPRRDASSASTTRPRCSTTSCSPSRRARARSAGSRDAGTFRSATTRTRRSPRRPSSCRRGALGAAGRPRDASRPTVRIRLLGRGSLSINTRRREGLPRRGRGGAQGEPGRRRRRRGRRARRALGRARGRGGAGRARRRRWSLESLRQQCREHLAAYKIPRGLVLVPAVVRSPAGKADYRWAKRSREGARRPGGADAAALRPGRVLPLPRDADDAAAHAQGGGVRAAGPAGRASTRSRRASRRTCT